MSQSKNAVDPALEPLAGNFSDTARGARHAADSAQHPQLIACPNSSVFAGIAQERAVLGGTRMRLIRRRGRVAVVFVSAERRRKVMSVYVLARCDVACRAPDRP